MKLRTTLSTFGLVAVIASALPSSLFANSCLYTNGSALDMAAYVDSEAHPYSKTKDFDKAAAQLILLWQVHGVEALNKARHKWVLGNCFEIYKDCGFSRDFMKASKARVELPFKTRQPLTPAHLDAKPQASAVQWAKEEIGACALNKGGASPDINTVLAKVDNVYGETVKRRDIRACETAVAAIRRHGGDASDPFTAHGFAKNFLNQKSDAQRQSVCDRAAASFVKWGQDLSKYYIDKDEADARRARKLAARQAAQAREAERRRNSPAVQYNPTPNYNNSYGTTNQTTVYETPVTPFGNSANDRRNWNNYNESLRCGNPTAVGC